MKTKAPIGLFFLFIACSLIAYSRSLNSFFQSDDFDLLLAVHEHGPFGVWSLHSNFFRPIIPLSLYVNYKFFGLNPVGYHAINIVVHGISSFFVYQIGRLLLDDARFALIAGLIFLVLPAHAEPVSWIAGRTDVLSGCFAMGSIWVYLIFQQTARPQFRWLSLAIFALALLCKESVLILPIVVMVYEWIFAKRRSSPSYFGILFVFIIIRRLALGTWIGGYGAAVHVSFEPVNLLRGMIFLPLRAFLFEIPARLLPTLPIDDLIRLGTHWLSPIQRQIVKGIFLVGVLSVVGCGLFFSTRGRRSIRSVDRASASPDGPLLRFLFVAFVVALLPVINLGAAISIADAEGGRLLYFPSLFSVLLTVAGIRRIAAPWRSVLLGSVILIDCLVLSAALRDADAASQIAKNIVETLAAQPASPPLILANVPDNLRGAFIFRNGLGGAVQLFKTPQIARALCFHTLQSPSEKVQIRQEADGLSIRLLDAQDRFFPVSANDSDVALIGSQECRVKLPTGAQGQRILYYSAGDFHLF